MKHILVPLLLLLFMGNIQAQEAKTTKASFDYDKMYHSLSFGINGTKTLGGGDFKYALGYQFNPYLQVGLGTGIDGYGDCENCVFIPAYLEMKGDITSWNVRPYYAAELGIGFQLQTSDHRNFQNKPSGIYFRPHLGMKFKRKHFAFYLGVGYQMQKSTEKYDYGNENYNNTLAVKRHFKRTFVRFGFDF